MKTIGLISDTHGLLRPEVLDNLQGCGAILHGGDINKQIVLDQLKQIAPTYVVRGNADKEWAENIPVSLDLSLFGLHIFITHKKKDLPKQFDEYDLVLYGYSHKYSQKIEGDTHFVNPGSCGPRRFHQEITMAILTINDHGRIEQIKKVLIPHPEAKKATLENIQRRHIEKVIGEITKGRSVKEISERTGLSEDLTDQICRMYMTHPGVDADGIMTKLGL